MQNQTGPAKSTSIAVSVIVVLVTVAVVLFGALGVFSYRADRERQLQKLRTSLDTDVDQLATALSLPLWNFDRAQIDKVIESAMKDENVYAVDVRLSDIHKTRHARIRDENWRLITPTQEIPSQDMFVEMRHIPSADASTNSAKPQDDSLGTVQVYLTPRFVEASVHQTLVSNIITIASLGVILIFSLYWLLWRLVLRPLKEVEKYSLAVSSGNRTPLQPTGARFQGELETVRASTQEMVSQLDRRYAQLQEVELALRQSEGLMKSLIENLPVELWAKDTDGKYIIQNPASMQNWGNQLGKASEQVPVPHEIQQRWDNANRRALAGEVVRDQWHWKDPVRGERTFSEVVAPIYEGKLIRGMLGVNVDITEQDRANAARLISEERFQLVARATNDGIWDWNIATGPVYRSDRLKELLGFSADDDDSTIDIFANLLHPDDKERVRKMLDEHLGRRAAYDTEFRLRRKDGSYRWFRARGQAVWNDAGTPTRMAGSISDIHDSKVAEEKLLRYQQQLQSLASRLLLVEESERRNFSRLLHDHIGQNLTFAKIRLGGVLRSNGNDGAMKEAIEEVLAVVEQMTAETRTLTYDLSPPLLYEIGLDAALEWLGEQFQKRYGLECRLESPNEPETLNNDSRVILFQSARELLFNVVKHAKAKTATIISGRKNGSIRVTVRDDGIGFNPAVVGTGTSGFGLFNVRERLKYMGGEVEVESAPGRGSSVTLILPVLSQQG